MRSFLAIALCIAICACNPVLPVPAPEGSGTAISFGGVSSAATNVPRSTVPIAGEKTGEPHTHTTFVPERTPKDCTALGGTLRTERKPPLGTEFVVCILSNDRQCETNALASGRCPAHGVHVADATPAARYCMLIGGRYRKTRMESEEQGTCTLDEAICNVWHLWDGSCTF